MLSEKELANHIYEVFRFWFTDTIIPHPSHTDMYDKMAKEIKGLFPPKPEIKQFYRRR